MNCLDDNAVAAMVEGSMSDSEHASAMDHIYDCARCRRAVSHATATLETASVANDETLLQAPAGRSPIALLPGTTVDHYRVERIIGRGGMGEVYLAEDTHLGRKVALKVIRPDLVASEEAMQRFLFEARATARFNHPNIVAVYGVGDVEGLVYVALEYVEGQTLRKRIKSGGALQPEELVDVAEAIASALEEAHGRSILHRDLKPGNVLLGSGRVRVLDFGLAKVLHDADVPSATVGPPGLDAVDLTHTGTWRGTPSYMSPEQWALQPVDGSADVWALGVLMYEMRYGAHPYRAPSADAIRERVLNEVPIAVPDKDALGHLTAQCLHKDAAKRPSAAEVRSSIVAMRTRSPAAPRSNGSVFRLTMVVLTLVAGGVGLGVLLTPDSANRPSEAEIVSTAPRVASPPTSALNMAEPPPDEGPAPNPPPPEIVTPPEAMAPESRQPRMTARMRSAARRAGFASLAVQSQFEGRPMWAHVYVDGELRGQTPLTLRNLRAGRHVIRLQRASFTTATRRVNLRSSNTTRLRVELRRAAD